jgi:hypothetical protein
LLAPKEIYTLVKCLRTYVFTFLLDWLQHQRVAHLPTTAVPSPSCQQHPCAGCSGIMGAHSAGCPGLSVSREDGGRDGCASQQQHSFLLDSVVEVELDDAEEEGEEVTEEYLMEIDKDNVVIEVVQQHSGGGGNNSSSSSGAAQLFAKLIQEQHGESAS